MVRIAGTQCEQVNIYFEKLDNILQFLIVTYPDENNFPEIYQQK